MWLGRYISHTRPIIYLYYLEIVVLATQSSLPPPSVAPSSILSSSSCLVALKNPITTLCLVAGINAIHRLLLSLLFCWCSRKTLWKGTFIGWRWAIVLPPSLISYIRLIAVVRFKGERSASHRLKCDEVWVLEAWCFDYSGGFINPRIMN